MIKKKLAHISINDKGNPLTRCFIMLNEYKRTNAAFTSHSVSGSCVHTSSERQWGLPGVKDKKEEIQRV